MGDRINRVGASHIIMVMADKGGVGKTAFAVNLAVALAGYGFKTMLVDGDMVHPSVSLHLEIEPQEHDVISLLQGTSGIKDVIVTHRPSGLDVIPCAITDRPIVVNTEMVERFLAEMSRVGKGYDFMVIDTEAAASRFISDELKGRLHNYLDEIVLMATTDLSSIVNTIKLVKMVKTWSVKSRIVINMKLNKPYELNSRRIEKFFGESVFIELPWTTLVPKSTYEHIPAVILDPRSGFSSNIKRLAYTYIEDSYSENKIRSRRGKVKQFAVDQIDFGKRGLGRKGRGWI